MQTDFVRAQSFRNGGMIDQRSVECRQISFEIDSSKSPRNRSARLTNFMPLEALIGDDPMLGQRGGLLGFIDAQFDLVIAVGLGLHMLDVVRQLHRFIDARPYLTAARSSVSSSNSNCAAGQRNRFVAIAIEPTDFARQCGANFARAVPTS